MRTCCRLPARRRLHLSLSMSRPPQLQRHLVLGALFQRLPPLIASRTESGQIKTSAACGHSFSFPPIHITSRLSLSLVSAKTSPVHHQFLCFKCCDCWNTKPPGQGYNGFAHLTTYPSSIRLALHLHSFSPRPLFLSALRSSFLSHVASFAFFSHQGADMHRTKQTKQMVFS